MVTVLTASVAPWPLTFLLLRCALAAIFAAAAVSKALDRKGTQTAVTELGIHEQFVSRAAAAVVIAEIAVATCLVVTPLAAFGALGALALLIVLSAIVAVNLRAGRRPACNCFGRRSKAPIGASTLFRNAVLGSVAAAIVIRSRTAGDDGLGRFDQISTTQLVVAATALVVGSLLVFHSWLLVNVMQQNGRLLDRMDQLEAAFRPVPVAAPTPGQRIDQSRTVLPIGSPAPRFELPDFDGVRYGIDDALADGQPTVLAFFETHCDACVELAAELNTRIDPSVNRIVAIVQGTPADVAQRFAGPGFVATLVDREGTVAERYGISGTPSAVIVATDGMTGSAMSGGRAAVNRLLRETETTGIIALERISR